MKLISVFFFIFLITFNIYSFDNDVSDNSNSIQLDYPSVKNNYIRPGEKFEYRVRWGFITVGSAEILIKPKTEFINDREVMIAVSTARTASFFDPIYRVRDSITSYIDKKGMFSWKFIKIQREGPYMRDEIINYDYFNNQFIIQTTRYRDDVSERTDIIELNDFIQDVLSCLYITRLKELKVGHSYLIPTNSQTDVFDIKVNVIKKESISVPAGRFDTILIEPNMYGKETIFKQEGTLKIWLTDDNYRIPVRMDGQIVIGSVRAALTNYHIPQN